MALSSERALAAAGDTPRRLGHPIRLICLDVDGTLLDGKYVLRENVRLALHRADQAGVALAICTGRNLHSTASVLDALGLKVSIITCSGAHILTADGRTHQVRLDAVQAHEIVDLALRAGSGLLADRPERSWAFGDNRFVSKYAAISTNAYTTDIGRALEPPPLKISVINDREVLRELRHQIARRYPDLQLASPFATVLDVTPGQATKGIGLRKLGDWLGIPLEQAAAIGDSENDISIFQEAGLAIAMANSSEEVRSAANWVAPSNDEEGVAWAVNRILGSNRCILAPSS